MLAASRFICQDVDADAIAAALAFPGIYDFGALH
jgi:hypothetical protein